MIDAYYTPDHLANAMIRLVTSQPKTVADFAAGNGALLSAATKRWPQAKIVASDCCDVAIRRLRSRKKDWRITKVDFISELSRARSKILTDATEKIDLVLLNPPFSCRGASKFESEFHGNKCVSSLALTFVVVAARYLSENGEIVAMLPESVLESQKDRDTLNLLKEKFVVRVGTRAKRGEFEDCHAKCVAVRFSKRKKRRAVNVRNKRVTPSIDVILVRGSVPLHLDTGSERTLVHSTDLIDHRVILNGHVACANRPSVIGPCVLIHRVGMPKLEKIAIYKRRKRVVLSDCVIGIQCDSLEGALWLHAKMCETSKQFLELYKGTCAPYITLEKLERYLKEVGCRVVD